MNTIGGNVNSVSNDPDDILGTYIGFSVNDLIKSKDKKAFIAQFDPLGEGHYVYDVATGGRAWYWNEDGNEEYEADDEWTIQLETTIPAKSVNLSGDELRDLFRQAIIGMLPVHPELKEAYDDL
ncbi:hypothetical protein [Deinococcus xinjiangensis]|uniref:hypothetical protein n=1 Tax=Deinococcus xinjiangensis TaxID=457454 RepID=UPI0033653A77